MKAMKLRPFLREVSMFSWNSEMYEILHNVMFMGLEENCSRVIKVDKPLEKGVYWYNIVWPEFMRGWGGL